MSPATATAYVLMAIGFVVGFVGLLISQAPIDHPQHTYAWRWCFVAGCGLIFTGAMLIIGEAVFAAIE